MPSLKDLYRKALQDAPSSFEAGELFRFVTGISPVFDLDAPAAPAMERELTLLLEARADGYPLQYLLGEWEFYGLPLQVGPGVLIPRQDTETLVDTALGILKRGGKANPEVLDICSGSGCIAIAVKFNFPGANVTALEFSQKAYLYLEKNIALNGVDVTPIHGDLRDYKHPAPVDMIVSNPPYIPKGDIAGLQAEVSHEPVMALDGGEDGLTFFREIARLYRGQFAPGGVLLLEIGAGQQERVAEILASYGYADIRAVKDLNGIVRVMVANIP